MNLPLLHLASTPDPADSGGTGMVEIALLVFFVIFLGISAWALLVRRGGFNAHARIPLEDAPVTPRDGRGNQHHDRSAEARR